MQTDFERFLADFPISTYSVGEYFIEQATTLEYVFYVRSGSCAGSIFTPNGNEYIFDAVPADQGIRSVAGMGISLIKDSASSFSMVALSDIVCRKFLAWRCMIIF